MKNSKLTAVLTESNQICLVLKSFVTIGTLPCRARLGQVGVVALIISQCSLEHAQRAVVTPQVNAGSLLNKFHLNQFSGSNFSPKPGKRKNLDSARAAHQKHDYSTLGNQPESFMNEAISLMSIDDSSVNLTRNGEQYNLFLHLKSGPLPQRIYRNGRSRLTSAASFPHVYP